MSGIPRRALAEGAVSPGKLHDSLKFRRFFHIKSPDLEHPVTLGPNGYAFPSGADDSDALVDFGNGNPKANLLYYNGAATVLGPTLADANGLKLSLDATNAEGAVYAWGIAPSSPLTDRLEGPFRHTVGTSKAIQIRAKLKVTTVANVAELCVGFFKGGEYTGATLPDDFTDAAFLNVQAGDVKIETILNDAATATKDTGVNAADATLIELRVVIDTYSAAGRVRFFVDGTEYYPTATFTFDSGDVVHPFIMYQHGAAANSAVYCSELEISELETVDDYYVN